MSTHLLQHLFANASPRISREALEKLECSRLDPQGLRDGQVRNIIFLLQLHLNHCQYPVFNFIQTDVLTSWNHCAVAFQFSTNRKTPGLPCSWYTSKKIFSGSAMTPSYAGLSAARNFSTFSGATVMETWSESWGPV